MVYLLREKRPSVFNVLFIALLLFAFPMSVGAETREWRAEWMTTDAPEEANQWTVYRKVFELDSVPDAAPAHIACDSKYWLWVNGEMVVFEGQLKRGPNRDDSYFDTVDLAPYLKEGENLIAILHWFWGKHGFSHNDSGKAGLVFELELGDRILVSGGSWKARRHPAYFDTGPPHPNFRLPEPNVGFDARQDVSGWMRMDYDAGDWDAPRLAGVPPTEPWGKLHPRTIPQWQDSGLVDYESIRKSPQPDGSVQWIGELPYNAQVTPWLDVEAPAGMTIDIRTDHYRGGGPPNVRAEYITREGRQTYESLGWMNGHEVIYTIPEGVEVHGIRYRETSYDSDWMGSFVSDDDALNILWKKAARTLQVNMRDTFFDCPDRERAQWVGDAVIEFHQVYYLFEPETALPLIRKAIREMIDWRRDDGILYSPVPAGWEGYDPVTPPHERGGVWDRELPMQILAFISEPTLWNYYLYTGDTETLDYVYSPLLEYLKHWELDERGLVKHREGDWDWPDWGENHDVLPLENAWYYSALKSLRNIAALTGRSEGLDWIESRIESIEAAYNDAYWRGDRYHDPDFEGDTDDRANAMAVVSGLAKEEYYPALREVFKTQKYASPYMEKFVLDALTEMGAHQQAMDRIKERWGPQVDNGITTLYEGWGPGEEGYGGGTVNHSWAGGKLTVLSQSVAGISPIEPGWERFAVKPAPGNLRKIDAKVPTSYGTIGLKLRRDGTVLVIEVDVPNWTEAEFALEDSWMEKVESLELGGESVAVEPHMLGGGRHRIVANLQELPEGVTR